ncbi:MAG: type II secretion system F family protein [Elusimicrobia bacterium]|nr:type II secretion system F family protein [Elusimicrobiota bacterium]
MKVWVSSFVGGAVACVVAALGSGTSPPASRLRAFLRAVESWTAPWESWSHPWWLRYSGFLARRLSQIPATRGVSPGQWVGMQVTGMVIMGIGGAVLCEGVGGNSGGHPVWLLSMTAAGGVVPLWWLSRAVRQRHAAVIRALPETLDLLTMMVEAGRDVMAALEHVGSQVRAGPWRDELTAIVQELHVGVSRAEALQHLAERVHHPWVIGLATQLIQATQMGASVGPMLRVHAKELRVQWTQWAEERAAQAPIRLLAPLALLFLPAILLVLIGPVVLLIMTEGW